MAGLTDYRRKRDFAATPEPAGGDGAAIGAGRGFVVQKHAARRLHYDFRLELDGTLKSWAVPKGPSLDPGEKRLAVEVEDHPLDYADFEGAIPRGQYGGGSVIVWDRGRWEPEGDPRQGLERGKLELRLHGEKLAGRWLLVRTRSRSDSGRRDSGRRDGGGKPSWLLRKLADEHARPGSGDEVVVRRPESVLSGRTVEEVAEVPGRVWQSDRRPRLAEAAAALPGAAEGPLPDAVELQLATPVDRPPEGAGWLHEIKLDGYRILCRIAGGRAELLSRRGKDWAGRFARVAAEAPFLPVGEALLDGEVVWLRPDGQSDFQALQQALTGAAEDAPIYFLAFDLLHLDGVDLRGAPLARRKALLRRLLGAAPADVTRLRLSGHHEGSGREVWERACAMGLEGTVAKRAAAPYRSGRGRDWVKVKCAGRQELVIVGWTESETAAPFRSLLLGFHDPDGGLTYAGKVGTGFDAAAMERLIGLLRPLERATTPLESGRRLAREPRPHWVEPRLVAEIAFTEWTRDGVLRHPSFRGLRDDKAAAEVVREKSRQPKSHGRARPKPPAAPAITNPGRVLWPDAGITKRDLVRYLETVAESMVPEIAGRPLTLLRCPEGIDSAAPRNGCFYQKHLHEGMPPALRGVEIEEKEGEPATYVVADSPEGLVALAQLGVLELHPWGSRVEHLGRPDRLIFDLDPDPGIGWERIVASARDLRGLLEDLGLASFPRLTGGKGVHLVVPIEPEIPWEQARALTRVIARLFADRERGLYTLNPLKAKRRGRIFVDYLRNAFGATAIASYSPRARPGAPVAVPIRWDELSPKREPSSYHLKNLPRRLASLREDPWEGARPQRLRPEIRARLGIET